jgi:hypothetical protein
MRFKMSVLCQQFTAVGITSNKYFHLKKIQFMCIKIEAFFINITQLQYYLLVHIN